MLLHGATELGSNSFVAHLSDHGLAVNNNYNVSNQLEPHAIYSETTSLPTFFADIEEAEGLFAGTKALR